jgi:hypothetical protein
VSSSLARVTLVISTLIVATGASPGIAQTRVASLEELRRELVAGDFIPPSSRPLDSRLRDG